MSSYLCMYLELDIDSQFYLIEHIGKAATYGF
jgi:hypothetical protein